MKVTSTYVNRDWLRCDEANRKLIDYIFRDQVGEVDYQI